MITYTIHKFALLKANNYLKFSQTIANPSNRITFNLPIG